MQSIGERLEEGRKRRGISVREASEATKIRGDFLLSFESNQFDVGLPEIYVRGFLRNYATFLKVDGEKLVTDYTAIVLGEAKPGRKETRELFGRMELPERQKPLPADGNPGAGAPTGSRRRAEEVTETRARELLSPELANYLKIGAIIFAGIAAILVIVLLVTWIIRSASGTATPPPAGNQPAQTTPAANAEIKLIAIENVWVKVTQGTADGPVLFEGPLAKGEEHTVQTTGPVYIAYTQGENLRIEQNGQQFRIPTTGPGRSRFEPRM